jgi:hypothetical protein
MGSRAAASVLVFLAATVTGSAQPQQSTPPEKFSMRPVGPRAQMRGEANPPTFPMIRTRWAPACGHTGAGQDAKPICPTRKGLSLEVGGTGRLFATVSLVDASMEVACGNLPPTRISSHA